MGVTRAQGIPNLWFGKVPVSGYGDGLAVGCSYWIRESDHTVECDMFTSLSLPF
jgi:hypothetical protein